MADRAHAARDHRPRATPSDAQPVQDWLEHGDALLRLRLNRPKANLIDAEMIAALDGALVAWHARTDLRGVLLDAQGDHFSFGASVEEHLPANCAAMLGSLHTLVMRMLQFPVPVLVAVRGQCLGGGLEVALAGSMIFAAPDAHFGQPEMKLGVFAPAASVLLPYRINQPAAEDLLFSGRTIDATQANALGLVHTVFEDPQIAALALALAGVVVQGFALGAPPWMALALCATWSVYAFIRKRAAVPAAAGLLIETLALAPLALGLLWWAGAEAPLQFSSSLDHALLLAIAGPITALPLMAFTFGARRVTFVTLGLLQFLAPSLQFATGILFGEEFTPLRGVSFALIWAGLGCFAWDTLARARKS